MGQKTPEPDWLHQIQTLRASGYGAITTRNIVRGRQIKAQLNQAVGWVDLKLILQEIIKDIYPTDPESPT